MTSRSSATCRSLPAKPRRCPTGSPPAATSSQCDRTPTSAGLLGITDSGADLSDAYLQIDTAAGSPGAGLVSQTIQFHGTADRYTTTAGTAVVATLFSTATTSTANPAVTLRDVGANGGQAAAFAYDLARSVVYTRQGNPAWAGDERDAAVTPVPIKRSDDMFYGAKPGDVQPDWVDLNKVQIPQADEQQRLLVNLIEQMNLDKKPLPRFWYFPRGEKAVVVMTGDDHGERRNQRAVRVRQERRPRRTATSRTGTVSVEPPTSIRAAPITDAAAAAYEAAGVRDRPPRQHELRRLDAERRSRASTRTSSRRSPPRFPSVAAPSTNRTHCIAWSDWATQPKVELDHGIRLDTNYYYWPGAWVQNRPGYFTGSGMPMRFADSDGSLIDVYQATTQMTDESDITYSTHINTLLDNAIGAPGYYGVVTANMHTDSANHPGQQTIIASAMAKGVPVVSARQMLTWLDGRNGSSFDGPRLDRQPAVASRSPSARGRTASRRWFPTTSSGGDADRHHAQRLGGHLRDAAHQGHRVRAASRRPPATTWPRTRLTRRVPRSAPSRRWPTPAASATITWTTEEPSTSRVDFGTSAGGARRATRATPRLSRRTRSSSPALPRRPPTTSASHRRMRRATPQRPPRRRPRRPRSPPRRPRSSTRPRRTSAPERPVPRRTLATRVAARSSLRPPSAPSSRGRVCPAAGRRIVDGGRVRGRRFRPRNA